MVLQILQSEKEARDRGHSFDHCISHPSNFLPQAEHFKEAIQGYFQSSHLLPQLYHIREGLQKVAPFQQTVHIVGTAQVANIFEAIKYFISDTQFITFQHDHQFFEDAGVEYAFVNLNLGARAYIGESPASFPPN